MNNIFHYDLKASCFKMHSVDTDYYVSSLMHLTDVTETVPLTLCKTATQRSDLSSIIY
jgi:hypothetical protein